MRMIGKLLQLKILVVATVILLPLKGLAADSEHDIDFALRARTASVKEGNDRGQAASILLRGHVASTWSEHLNTYFEADHVSSFWQTQHSDGVRFNREPLVPDPPGSEINQLWLQAQSSTFSLRLGRQSLELDNQRFIGTERFWQNEQTFDASLIRAQWASASRIQYAYIHRAHRIYGDKAVQGLRPDWVLKRYAHNASAAALWGEHRHKSHLLHVELNEWDQNSLAGYAYFIDNMDWPASSNRTVGARYQHFDTVGAFKIRLELEAAIQERIHIERSPQPIYGVLALGAIRGPIRTVVRHERLGEHHDTGFTTPLASLHSFNGWADAFTFTPPQGLQDNSLHINWRASPWELDARYHLFLSANGRETYGEEIDVDLQYKMARQHLIQLRYANFISKMPDRQDTVKLYLDYSYHLR